MIRSEFMQEYEGINFLLEKLEERKQLLLEKRTRLENMRECSICYGIFSPEEIDKVQMVLDTNGFVLLVNFRNFRIGKRRQVRFQKRSSYQKLEENLIKMI